MQGDNCLYPGCCQYRQARRCDGHRLRYRSSPDGYGRTCGLYLDRHSTAIRSLPLFNDEFLL